MQQVTNLPIDVQRVVGLRVPMWYYNVATATGAADIPPLGMEPSLASKVNRSGDSMWGDLIMR